MKPIFFGYGSLQQMAKELNQENHVIAWHHVLTRLENTHRAIFSFSFKELSASEFPPEVTAAIESGLIYVQSGSVPHTWLFPYCSLIVHHGGSGTCQTAALMGVPSVIVSHISDQFFMASVMHFNGLAPKGINVKDFTEDRLFTAVYEVLVLRRDEYCAKALEVSKLMQVQNPITGQCFN